jgi:hypothetical protein
MKLSEKRNKLHAAPRNRWPDQGRLVDITELKTRMTQYGEKDEFRLVFETECEDEEERPPILHLVEGLHAQPQRKGSPAKRPQKAHGARTDQSRA